MELWFEPPVDVVQLRCTNASVCDLGTSRSSTGSRCLHTGQIYRSAQS